MVMVGGLGRSHGRRAVGCRALSDNWGAPADCVQGRVVLARTDNPVGGRSDPPTITTNRKDNPCGR